MINTVKDGEKFTWSGGRTCFCSNCHRLFSGPDGFERHYTTGRGNVMLCEDPALIMRQDGITPMFERIDKPGWNPDHVWRRNRPGRAKREFDE